jgi:hypothetical protein
MKQISEVGEKPFTSSLNICQCPEAESKESMGPNTGVYYKLTLFLLQSRLKHIYHGPMPETSISPQSGTSDLASAACL